MPSRLLPSALKAITQLFFAFLAISLLFPLTLYRLAGRILRTHSKPISPHSHAHQGIFRSEMEMTTVEGFKVRKYQFETQDGAHVSFWRVSPDQSASVQKQEYPAGRKVDMEGLPAQLSQNKSIPIILQHGLLDCSLSWFVHQQTEKTLPYLLAKEGYDVWVGNNRGTKYSTFGKYGDKFWDYSLDHLIQFDIPCMIDSVLRETGQDQLVYIGHSQGTAQFLTALDVHPDLQNKIKCFVGLGALITLKNLDDHLLIKVVNFFRVPEIAQFLGFKSLLILPQWMSKLVGLLVYNFDWFGRIVLLAIEGLCGSNRHSKRKINEQRLGLIVTHEPGGASVNNVTHWMQIYRRGHMCKFDFGAKKNMEIYGQKQSPLYTYNSLKDLPFNSYLFRGTQDSVIKETDFQVLRDSLHPDRHEVHYLQDYAHLDYLWCEEGPGDFYWRIVDIVKKETAGWSKSESEASENTETDLETSGV